MTIRDIDKTLSVVSSVAPGAQITADTNGASADLAGFRTAAAVIHAGVATDGTITPKLQESDNDSDWTDVAAGDLSGSFTAITSSADEVVQEVGYLGTKRYIRVVLTETVATTTGQYISAVIVRGNPISAPQ